MLRGIADGTIRCLAVDTPVPSQFAHELINANPYAFLDEAGLEERRARAVSLRRTIPDSVLEGAGRLDQAAIDQVRRRSSPTFATSTNCTICCTRWCCCPLDCSIGARGQSATPSHWPHYFERLPQTGRAQTI